MGKELTSKNLLQNEEEEDDGVDDPSKLLLHQFHLFWERFRERKRGFSLLLPCVCGCVRVVCAVGAATVGRRRRKGVLNPFYHFAPQLCTIHFGQFIFRRSPSGCPFSLKFDRHARFYLISPKKF